MQQVSLRDVCREAGVSLATVDRVLNGRAGVKPATLLRVRAAIERLGYRANPFASRLARGGSFRMAFILPRGNNAFMLGLAAQVERTAEYLAPQRVGIEIIHVDAFDPERLAAALDGLGETYQGVAVVALDHKLVRAAIDRLMARGVHVVTLVSDAPASRRLRYVGVDNIAAGRTAGTLLGRFLGERGGAVGVIIGSADLHDHTERLQGFMAVLTQEHPRLAVLPARIGQDDDAVSASAAAALLAEHADLVGLYAAGAGTGGVAQALRAAGRAREVVFIGHELGEHGRWGLLDGTVDALINQDSGHEARSAARILLAELTSEPVLPEQERIRIEIFLRDNLP